jgi:hypothetical protein
MIRRGFWFALGAVLGITGYRRVTRAARALLPEGERVGQLARRNGAGQPERRTASRAGAGTVAFVRDVRTGMADYLDRQREI